LPTTNAINAHFVHFSGTKRERREQPRSQLSERERESSSTHREEAHQRERAHFLKKINVGDDD
jgi:hypothetical protein